MIDYGQGVQLRTINHYDLSKLRDWRNDYRIFKWTRQNDLISESAHHRWFENQSTDSKIRMYIIRTPSHDPVGVCGLTDIDMLNRRAEFSLYIDPVRRNLGIGKKALKTLISHGFKTLGLNLIWGETFEQNPALKLFKNLGFTQEGIRRDFYFREGIFIDALLISLLNYEWKRLPIYDDCRTLCSI